MSRIGKVPIPLPKGVEVKILGKQVQVKGPKGSLELEVLHGVEVELKDNSVFLTLPEGNEKNGKFQGLYRSLINNMVLGVTEGYEKALEMQGVGFRAAVQGNLLDLQVGFSHPTKVEIPQDLTVKVEKNTTIFISGIDKRKVGQFAAEVRAKRPPEPYKGKGIRYRGEYVRRKAGKTAKK